MRSIAEKTIELVKDAIFPNICLCGKWGTPLCGDCKARLVGYKTGLCPVCRAISENGQTCKKCRQKSYLTGVMIYGKHKDDLKTLIWRFKYEFNRDLAGPLSELLVNRFGDFVKSKKLIVVNVPSSKQRQSWRGYNQSELLAKNLAKKLELQHMNILAKQDHVLPQVGLSRNERIKNIRGKIYVEHKSNIENQKVLLVDDVYTSGATLEECARLLRKAGAKEVWGIVLSRE